MKTNTKLFIELFALFRDGFGNAMAGLASLQKKKGNDPELCGHFKRAEQRFYDEGEYEQLYTICKQIVEEYERTD